jgi:dTDP-4-dehydrorhamnose reductase
MTCKCGENAVQKSVMKVVEMASETRRVSYPVTGGTSELPDGNGMVVPKGDSDAIAQAVVNDQFGKPTHTADLTRKTAEIVGLAPGIYHITNDGVCSWYEFAAAIIDNAEVLCRKRKEIGRDKEGNRLHRQFRASNIAKCCNCRGDWGLAKLHSCIS